MQRLTVSLDDALARDFDALVEARGYETRSEAVRDLMRSALAEPRAARENGHCVANLSFVYNHHERQMAARMAAHQHDSHDLVIATCHVHLDHDDCLETLMLKGPVVAVRALADAISSERGVRHPQLNLISVSLDHGHRGKSGHHHATAHLKPL